MIIKTRFVPKNCDALTVWPFIFVRPEKAEDRNLIEHEKAHYKAQARSLVLPWVLCF